MPKLKNQSRLQCSGRTNHDRELQLLCSIESSWTLSLSFRIFFSLWSLSPFLFADYLILAHPLQLQSSLWNQILQHNHLNELQPETSSALHHLSPDCSAARGAVAACTFDGIWIGISKISFQVKNISHSFCSLEQILKIADCLHISLLQMTDH